LESRTRELLGTILAIDQPRLVVIAGPNGAGKTTFYETFLASLPLPFVNADRIARTLAPEDPASIAYGAAEVADRERRELLALRRSFIMETVFSDPAGDKLGFLRDAQAAGYAVILLFVGIESPDLSILRVTQRVLEGGHDVPPDKLQQRFPRTQRNLAAALRFVAVAAVFDNSSLDQPYRHVATWHDGHEIFRDPAAPAWCPAGV
jgi:predicted ABC-type ATPase